MSFFYVGKAEKYSKHISKRIKPFSFLSVFPMNFPRYLESSVIKRLRIYTMAILVRESVLPVRCGLLVRHAIIAGILIAYPQKRLIYGFFMFLHKRIVVIHLRVDVVPYYIPEC